VSVASGEVDVSLDPEAVTQAGSGLTFINYYEDSVTDPYRAAILNTEHFLQSHFTDQLTISINFSLDALGAHAAAQNAFATIAVSYDAFTAALRSHATSADDLLAVNGLPQADPSGGVGFGIPISQAVMLGLIGPTNLLTVDVTLNSSLAWTFGQDAVGALLHEITEGGFGRIGSLGLQSDRWEPMDLFRFSAAGVRDFTGGRDGVTTFFGFDSAHVSDVAYHNAIAADGTDDGQDLADWGHTVGDAFGPSGPGGAGTVTDLDLRILDILGWRPASAGAFVPAADEFAGGLTDAGLSFGGLSAAGTATGALQTAGDRDWFRVDLQAGATYMISVTGGAGGGGTLADPYLRLHNSAGAVLASNDDRIDGALPDSRLVFAASAGGTYYIDAGAFLDGYAGSYTVSLVAGTSTATAGDDLLIGPSGGGTMMAGAGADTVLGADGANYLRGDDGADSITGGAAFDDINGNMGADTAHGGPGDDWVVGGKDNDNLFGDAGGDIVYGNLGDDSCDGGSGADLIRGGQGADTLAGGTGNDWLSGDRGSDTLTGGTGADTFHTFSGAGIDVVTDFSLADGDRVQVDAGVTWTLSQSGADTVIDLGGGDQMILKNVQLSTLTGTWIFSL
jgi:Ca2+-binding RTX toxin-like protein